MADLFTYLAELRLKLVRVFIVFFISAGVAFCWHKPLFNWVLIPLRGYLPESSHVIMTSLTDLVLAPLQLGLWVGVLCSWPFLIIQLWQFFAPALYPQERTKIRVWLWLSSIMLWLGLMAGGLLLLPQMIAVLISYLPESIVFLPDMRSYIWFALRCCFALGIVSQVPVLLWLMIHFQWVSLDTCRRSRRYVIVISLVVGMVLTPPDVLSQLMVGLPMWALYELSLAGFLIKQRLSSRRERLQATQAQNKSEQTYKRQS